MDCHAERSALAQSGNAIAQSTAWGGEASRIELQDGSCLLGRDPSGYALRTTNEGDRYVD
ncbi:MAG: hypothetical protein Q8N39_05430 [Pelolinea sp.]|nr:hypothetical protein [Pelolinea sp.]